MSKSYKREDRAQARAVQARRVERRIKHDNFRESPDKIFELPRSERPFHMVKK